MNFHTWRWRLSLRRSGRDWHYWRKSGTLVVLAYLLVFALIALVSLWQTYHFPLPWSGAGWSAVASALYWLWNTWRAKPALHLSDTDRVGLRLPIPAWQVLSWPLGYSVVRSACLGIVLGGLLWAWAPAWWTVWLSQPFLLAGAVLLGTLRQDGQRQGQAWVWLLSVSPVLAAWSSMLLPVISALACALAFWRWRSLWQHQTSPQALEHWRRRTAEQQAQRLNLPLPPAKPTAWAWRRWRPAAGPLNAALWYGLQHVGQRPLWLSLALLWGGLYTAVLPLDPTPLFLALLLSPLVALLPPVLPAAVPLTRWQRGLGRALPPLLVGGVLALLGGSVAVLSGYGTPLGLLLLLLSLWAALGLRVSVGAVQVGGPPAVQLHWAAAFVPQLALWLVGPVWGSLVLVGLGALVWLTS